MPGTVRHVEVDTGYYVGNAPGWVRLSVTDFRGGDLDAASWTDIVTKRPVVPDTRHRLVVEQAVAATHVRLDVYPDGGLSRLRLWGEAPAALTAPSPSSLGYEMVARPMGQTTCSSTTCPPASNRTL